MAVLGGALTAAMFAGGRYLIGFYLAHANPASAYGSMGTLALAMVWIYYAGLVVFLGALLTAVLDERRGSRAATASGGPAATTSTRPSGRFRTQPWSRSRSACCTVAAR